MDLDEITISRTILSAQMNTVINYMDWMVAVIGARPAGLTCATLTLKEASGLVSLRRNSLWVEVCGEVG